MKLSNTIEMTDLKKNYKGFTLDIPACHIPKGFSTALIGENGAGKTTLLNILAGLRLDFNGTVRYFDTKESNVDNVKERLGYTGPGNFFLPHWNMKQVGQIGELLFSNFDHNKFDSLCKELGITEGDMHKKVSSLSDGNRMKLVLATALARDTDCLIMDEPASPLDPLLRDKLCDLIRNYIEQGKGEKSVLFSTHNISDMENVTDYCLIMEHGEIVEAGFVEDLKEKYVLVKGESMDATAAKKICYSFTGNSYGFEGICLSEKLDQLAGMDITLETPTLFQISVAVMKAHTTLSFV